MIEPAQVVECLNDLVIEPRNKAIKWSKITRQTPNLKLAYPSQHIVSLFTGIPGTGTAARGFDLADGSEVKTCSLIDQLDICKSCGEKVLKHEEKCPFCDSKNISRRRHCSWVFNIKNDNDIEKMKDSNYYLVLYDYLKQDLEDILCSVFKVDGQTLSQNHKDYYQRIINSGQTNKYANARNLYPYTTDFLALNSETVGEVLITKANDNPKFYFLFK